MMEEVNNDSVMDFLEEEEGENDEKDEKKTDIQEFVQSPYKCGSELENVVHFGWGNKWSKAKIGKVFWLKRFFILTKEGELYYYKHIKSKKPCKPPVIIAKTKFWRSKVKRNCIQIERELKPFYFYFNTSNERQIWMDMFCRVGGVKSKALFTENRKPEISTKTVKRWNEGNVFDWMEYVPLDGRRTLLDLYQNNFKGVDGSLLLSFNDKELRERNIKNRKHRKTTKRMINILKRESNFDLGFHIVLRKLTEMLEEKRGHLTGGSRTFLAENLSNPESMRKTYLNLKEFARNIRLSELIKDEGIITSEDSEGEEEGEKEEEKEEEEEEGNIHLSLTLRREVDPKEKEELKSEYEEDMILKSKNGEIAKGKISIENYEEKIGKFPVKLVVTEVTTSNRYKTARKLISPVMTMIPHLKQEFGLFHTALIVGPWYLEWNDSSIIIPRQMFSSMALLSADIEFTVGLKQQSLKEVTKILSEIICRWNRTKTYRNVPISDKNLGNCQQFVEDVMEGLGLYIKQDGCFGKYMTQMRNKGVCDITFEPSTEFKEKFSIDHTSITFRSHMQLDKFVTTLIEKDELSLDNEFNDSFRLLKSFDRAFWLRYLKAPCERYKPLEDIDGRCSCPFDDPRRTKSFVGAIGGI